MLSDFHSCSQEQSPFRPQHSNRSTPIALLQLRRQRDTRPARTADQTAAGLRERRAAVGAAAGAVQNNQYDNASGALKDANREDKAKTGAAAGMAAAGSRNRQDRRQDRRSEDDWQKSYDACVAAKPPQ